ncbi:Ferroporti-1 [Limtongia smithiae]|uniref:Ferroporti-1 n=1 Tax=Limtongia smithiae TaxID=1125753 RepID=UPI0034CFC868
MTVDANVLVRIYTSHFLSAFNSRIFEYSAVLFLAAIFPGTLLPSSVYALFRAIAAITLAPTVGKQVDVTNRLVVVRRSIIFQRGAVVVSCVLLLLMIVLHIGSPTKPFWLQALFISLLSLFACVEKLASILNTVAVERDWVVVIAGSDTQDLQQLNSSMRRIDLFCKMAGPLFISLLVGVTLLGSVITLIAVNSISVFIEYFTIARVYSFVPALASRGSAEAEDFDTTYAPLSEDDENIPSDTVPTQDVKTLGSPLHIYTHHEMFLPSLGLAVLYFTVLNFGGQFVTYLLALGYGPFVVGILRTGSVVFELAATWIAPLLMNRVGPVRAGLWLIHWQAVCCVVAAVAIYKSTGLGGEGFHNGNATFGIFGSATAFVVVLGVVLSRVGLWGFDLCAEILIQENVEAEVRSVFSSVESSFQNFFELLSFASTIVFDKADMFWVPAALSANSVIVGVICMAIYTRRVRKHLVHMPSIMSMLPWGKKDNTRTGARELIFDHELGEI